MSWEIELKARLSNPQDVENFLSLAGVFGKNIEKKDVYFQGPTPLRLRFQEETTLVTSKTKIIGPDHELNRELEFSVSDVPSFLIWLANLGFKETYRKTKQGRAYLWKETLVEIVEVPPLGWFVEIEKVLGDDADEKQKAEALREVRTVLQELHVPFEDVENRPYAELLGLKVPSPPKEA